MRFSNTSVAKSSRVIFAALLLLVFASINTAQDANEAAENNAASNDVFVLTAERLHSAWEGELNNAGWRYQAGDDARWAARDFDDRDWERIKSTWLNPADLPSAGWTGAA